MVPHMPTEKWGGLAPPPPKNAIYFHRKKITQPPHRVPSQKNHRFHLPFIANIFACDLLLLHGFLFHGFLGGLGGLFHAAFHRFSHGWWWKDKFPTKVRTSKP